MIWLFPCSVTEHFEECVSLFVAWLITSIYPAVLGGTSAFHLVSDRSLTWPTVPTPHLFIGPRQHQDDCVQMIGSLPDRRRRRSWLPPTILLVLFGSCDALLFPFGRYTYERINKNMTEFLPLLKIQLNLCPVPVVCSCILGSHVSAHHLALNLC